MACGLKIKDKVLNRTFYFSPSNCDICNKKSGSSYKEFVWPEAPVLVGKPDIRSMFVCNKCRGSVRKRKILKETTEVHQLSTVYDSETEIEEDHEIAPPKKVPKIASIESPMPDLNEIPEDCETEPPVENQVCSSCSTLTHLNDISSCDSCDAEICPLCWIPYEAWKEHPEKLKVFCFTCLKDPKPNVANTEWYKIRHPEWQAFWSQMALDYTTTKNRDLISLVKIAQGARQYNVDSNVKMAITKLRHDRHVFHLGTENYEIVLSDRPQTVNLNTNGFMDALIKIVTAKK